ncbi:MAG TPA: hypothetical protein VGM03_23895, partial [Phycisphaerae bacterium]
MKRYQLGVSGIVSAMLFVATQPPSARGQCEPQWLPGEGIPGVNGIVYATTTWDPDGDGPQLPLVVVGGSFSVAGDVLAANVAAWDGTEGVASLGTRSVTALTVFDGELIAGGNFTAVGGVSANRVARWNGSAWQPLGNGVGGVCALAIYNEELIAGGYYAITRWDGTAWLTLGMGLTGTVRALTPYADQLLVGETAAMAAGVCGGQPLDLRWRKDGVPLSHGDN